MRRLIMTSNSTSTLPSIAVPMRCIVLGALLLASAAHAGEGHDHGDAPVVANANGPSRQADGSVFLPKPAQRQLYIRTVAVSAADLSRTHELQGRVVMDPNAGGRVQATTAGRLEAGPKGLPTLGQTVRKGEVLAHVVPIAAPLERAGQAAQLAELRASQSLADKRLARLRELSDTVPRREIEAAESEVASLAARVAAIGGGLSGREALVAPVTGVIGAAQAVAGQVVDARELVYEIVDPARLQIEAVSFDPEIATTVTAGSLALGDRRVPLRFVGAARTLREQALPLMFRTLPASGPASSSASTPPPALAVGQPVKVFVQTQARLRGTAVPSGALLKNPANQDIVWVKTAPERFEPRLVTFVPLDGVSVAVTAGLKDGDRVATQGATLINQVR